MGDVDKYFSVLVTIEGHQGDTYTIEGQNFDLKRIRNYKNFKLSSNPLSIRNLLIFSINNFFY